MNPMLVVAIYLLRMMNNPSNNHNNHLCKKRNHHIINHHHNKNNINHLNNKKNSSISPQALRGSLIPKTESDMQYSPGERLLTDTLISMSKDEQRPPQEEEPASQSVVEAVPVFPTQEVIDISSGFDDDNEPQPQPIKLLLELGIFNAPWNTRSTPQPTQAIEDDFDERVATWATVPKGGNDYEPVFRLLGPQILEAIRYQFMSMAPKSYIDIGIVRLMCHVLNREEGDRYEKLVYCLPPEILQRMFFTHDHNWMQGRSLLYWKGGNGPPKH
ncbi:hypothetical protein PIB30_063604 [Stylosanthes scabra]|uniref:Uncharacterized protein n=1 Tax=Stylosanthes scabra TaxID=79078 RepID=A0ABU6VNW1_9FABA|nr:hypothetical protein [Stylosanthes scabra]